MRLPKKMNGQHRGFGFVDFLTHEDADKCMKSLFHTHFYGRHLVLDWAEDDETVDDIREKTRRREKIMTSSKKSAKSKIELLDPSLEED